MTVNVYSLNIGLTNRCNLRCMFCPVINTQIKREDMPMPMVRRIITEAHIEHHVSLALFGESTLYTELPEVIRIVKQKGVESILYTNGLVFNPGIADVDKVIFSLDAFDRNEYIKHKGIDGYDRVIANIKRLRLATKRPHITIQFADLKYNMPKIEEIKKLADYVKIGRFVTWGGEIEYHGTVGHKIREKKPCSHIFKFLNIASNGDVVLCCFDYNHSFDIGNVSQENVMDIWNGEKFNKIRSDQISGKFADICLNCENESYYSPH